MSIRHGILILLLLALASALLLVQGPEDSALTAARREACSDAGDPVQPAPTLGARELRHVPVADISTGVTYRGHALDRQGRPIPGARLRWSHSDGPWTEAGTTAADGSFSVTVPGEHTDLEILAPDGRRVREDLFNKAGRVVRVRLHEVVPLEGAVLREVDRGPVADARVWIRSWKFGIVETRTRADGTFRLEGVPRRLEFSVHVAAGAGGHLSVDKLVWAPGVHLELRLPPVRTLRGRVVRSDADGVVIGVPDVRVSSWYGIGGSRGGVCWDGRATDAEATTDASGAFLLEGLTKRYGDLSVHSDRWEPVDDVEWSGEEDDVLLPVRQRQPSAKEPSTVEATEAGATFEGVVLDEDGGPLRGVDVRLWGNDAKGYSTTWDGTSGVDGRYRIVGIHPGTHELVLEATGYDYLNAGKVTVEAGAAHVHKPIHLERLVECVVRIVDEDGESVPSASLYWWPNPPGHHVPVRPDGRFRFWLPKAREFHVDAEAPGHVARRFERADMPEEGEWALVLPRASVIEGRVLDTGGGPVRSAFVHFAGEFYAPVGDGVLTDLDGRFRIEVHPGCTYRLEVVSWRLEGLLYLPCTGVACDAKDVVFRPTAPTFVAGRLVDPQGVGLAHIRIVAEPAGAKGVKEGEDTTDADGYFRVDKIIGRSFCVRVHIAERDLEPLGLDVRPLRGVQPGTESLLLQAERTLTIQGSVHWPNGSPAAEVEVVAYSSGHDAYSRCADTDAHGHFKITSVLPGPWAVEASAYADEEEEEYCEAEVAGVAAGARGVRLTLELVPEDE